MSTPTPTGLDLEAIEAREKAATKGPWILDHDDTFVRADYVDGDDWDWIVGDMAENSEAEESDLRGQNIQANCRFIAYARQDIPALIAEVRRLREVAEAAGEYVRERLRLSGEVWVEHQAWSDLRQAVDRWQKGEA